ncbi:MAG TPA: FAD-dependent oxidoreductase [Candidatus Limnocylindrales bacterium]|nr:FAD-dependent oxidoreductase [Candidatus Limnocylindrales bacterium]
MERGGAPDVVVIGAGIVGTSAAAYLAEAGRTVLLVEQTAVGAGASGRNSGVVQHPFDPVLVGLHLETLDLYRGLDGFELPAKPVGLLSVTSDVDGVRRLTDAIAATHAQLRPRFISPDEMRLLEPSIAPGMAACRLDIGYPVGPAHATRAFAARAERAGVEIRVGTSASISRIGGRADGVAVDGERIRAGDVLVAAGPWSPAVVDPSGAWRPIVRRWGVVVQVTLASPPTHVLEEAEISIEPGAEEEDDAAGHAFSLVTAAGVSSLGSTFLADEPDVAATVPSLIRRGSRFVPAIAGAPVGPARLCARPLSLDGRPLIGRIPGTQGLWIAGGHGPWGISTGPASGRLIADLIDGRTEKPPTALDPARFGRPPG